MILGILTRDEFYTRTMFEIHEDDGNIVVVEIDNADQDQKLYVFHGEDLWQYCIDGIFGIWPTDWFRPNAD